MQRMKKVLMLTLPVAALGLVALASSGGPAGKKDDAASREAFLAVYKVLMHPRCMNCHPNGDAPLQGDDSRRHIQNVKRGQDGKGVFALKCANCHQDVNLCGDNMPPGNPNWHLPPWIREWKYRRVPVCPSSRPIRRARKT